MAAAGNPSMGAFAALLAPHEIHPRQFAHPLHLTAAGRRCFGQLRQLAAAQEERMLDGLDPADRERLRLLLVRVSANLGMTPGEPGGIRAW